MNAGGYDQLCWEVAERLRLRGHTLRIITSNYLRKSAPIEEKDVNRSLNLEGDPNYYSPIDFLLFWKRRLAENLRTLESLIEEFQPDIVVFWSLWALSKSLPAMVERTMPEKTAYYLAGYWPAAESIHEKYWQTPVKHVMKSWIKRTVSNVSLAWLEDDIQLKLQLKNVMCVSAALRDSLVEKGLAIENARIIHNGIDVEQFAMRHRAGLRNLGQGLRLLYAGQIAPHKGVHTAIEAMDHLVNDSEIIRDLVLTIVGNGHPEYERSLQRLVSDRGLGAYIEFRDRIPREMMPDLLREFDVLVLPSTYDEPLARIAQEAMATGLVVVSTLTGGMRELLTDGENGLAFAPGDPSGLAAQIDKIYHDRELAKRLTFAGRKTIVERFNIERMVDLVEGYLGELAKANKIQ